MPLIYSRTCSQTVVLLQTCQASLFSVVIKCVYDRETGLDNTHVRVVRPVGVTRNSFFFIVRGETALLIYLII